MDVYGLPVSDCFRIDDLLDFSNDNLFSSSASSSSTAVPPADTTTAISSGNLPPPENPSNNLFYTNLSTDFTGHLNIPSDDVAQLEWLSQFVEDSFTDFPDNSLAGTLNVRSDASFSGRARSKRSRGTVANNGWSSLQEYETPATGKCKAKKESCRSSSPTPEGGVRRCTHCASEKTPQWRTGPRGPKTLCNACGVRYKSGRLVPEYRPAASPTFVLTQHSNSHRKVLELRRQKEMVRRQQDQIYSHSHDFEVC